MTVKVDQKRIIDEVLTDTSSEVTSFNFSRGVLSGTSIQPHSVVAFVKGSDNCRFSGGIQRWQQFGYLPIVSIFTGAIRVASAVKLIFKTLLDRSQEGQSSRLAQLKVGRYNLLRGLVEIVPFTFAALMKHDVNRFYKVEKAIKMTLKENNVAGVAIDGKVIAAIPLTIVDAFIDANKDKEKKTIAELSPVERDQRRLAVMSFLVETLVNKAVEKKSKASMEKILQQVGPCFAKHAPKG